MKFVKFFLSLILSTGALFASIDNLSTFSADFRQTITNEQNQTITYEGKVYAAKKESSALWEYHKPVVKKIYYRSGEIIIVEPELEQAIFAKLNKIPNLLKLLKEAKEIGPGLFETEFNHIRYRIRLDKEGNIDRINYTDELSNRVVISFSNQKQNRYIDQKLFICKIPTGYDILQQK
ncbi:MAG: hypothetical protein B6D59_03150 [Campylobacteraceae bacterium 4484_4]|nr:MAG: hypothetical protein B6D59_03150 [Campylobacteraceae bacterium 4484_4]